MEGNLLNKPFLANKWPALMKFFKKVSKVENEITQTIEKYNKELYSTQSRIGQNASIENEVFQQAINIMRTQLKIWI